MVLGILLFFPPICLLIILLFRVLQELLNAFSPGIFFKLQSVGDMEVVCA